jgi:hypothetical protein
MPPNQSVPTPVIVVDAANVVGSKPDGWWRDRKTATARLRDGLADLADKGVPEPGFTGADHPQVILVVEGQARGVDSSPTVELVAANSDRPCVVVTADRELRTRVTALGAQVLGPRSVRD